MKLGVIYVFGSLFISASSVYLGYRIQKERNQILAANAITPEQEEKFERAVMKTIDNNKWYNRLKRKLSKKKDNTENKKGE